MIEIASARIRIRVFGILGLAVALAGAVQDAPAQWTNGRNASLVLGQDDFESGDQNQDAGTTPSATGLRNPKSVAVDPMTGKVKLFGTWGNDGTVPDDLTACGARGNKKFRVKYFSTSVGKANVTAPVIAGTHVEDDVEAAGTRSFMVEVKPTRKTRDKKKRWTSLIKLISVVEGQDNVKCQIKTLK